MHAVPEPTNSLDLDVVNARLRDASPETVIDWARQEFGESLAASTSFGATSAVMLHMISRVAPDVPIICIDTGYLFPETYRFAEMLTQRFGLDVRVYTPRISPARQEALYGNLWEQGEEGVQRYLQMNKVEPMQRALHELNAQAWMAGVRSQQTEHRASLRVVDVQDGRVKLHPILNWTEEQIEAYMEEHELPYHPLYSEGYRSIGDHHSTIPTTPDMDPRDGRILGKKRECGLHLPLTEEQNQSLKSSGL